MALIHLPNGLHTLEVLKGRMEETKYADVEEENAGVEYDFDLTEQQVTPLKALLTAVGLVSTAEDIQDTDEEQTKALEQQEQERANLKAALKLQKTELYKLSILSLIGNIHTEDSRKSLEDYLEPTEDMERALWAELKRLYEPDKEDTLQEALHLLILRKGFHLKTEDMMFDAQQKDCK
ncbi:hypothetical protein Tco_0900919 [Tanacetum coccineum]